MTDFLIDAENIPLAERDLFIFKTITNLGFGDSLVIKSDQDPLPLLLHSTDSKETNFDYEYIEKGPDKWTVIIRKNRKTGCCGFCGN